MDDPAQTSRHLSRRRVILGAGVVGLGAALGAPSIRGLSALGRPTLRPLVDELVREIVVVGDSITAEAEPLLEQLLRSDGFSSVIIDGERSRRIAVSGGSSGPRSGMSVMTEIVESGVQPAVWVVALGTNDIGSYATTEDFEALIGEMLALIPPDAPLVWVNAYLPDRLESTTALNDAIDRALRRRERSAVASWLAVCSAPDDELLRSDRIHPNERGRVVFATLVATTVRQLVLTVG